MSFLNGLGKVISFPVTGPTKVILGGITSRVESIINGQIRHLITAGAGALALHGYLISSDQDMFVAAAMQIVGMLLSAAEKKAGI